MLKVLQQRSAIDLEKIPQRLKKRRGFNAQQFVKHHKNFLQLVTRLRDAEAQAGDDRLAGLQAVTDYFYRGPIAREVDAWSKANGGLLRYSDFATHHTPIDQPIAMHFMPTQISWTCR